MVSRLANFRIRRRSRAPIVIIGDSDAGMWEPVPTTQAQGGGLARMPQVRGEWGIAGQAQAPRRQTTVADVITRYQHFLTKERRQPRAHFEVKA
jgi:hypothetical protein